MYNVNYTELLAQGVRKADPSWPAIRCKQGWTFNHTMIPYASIAAEVIKTRRYHFTCVNPFLRCVAEINRLINCRGQQNNNINRVYAYFILCFFFIYIFFSRKVFNFIALLFFFLQSDMYWTTCIGNLYSPFVQTDFFLYYIMLNMKTDRYRY